MIWRQLQRKHNTAVLLGSGSTINDITMEEWKRIHDGTDTWTMNNWVYHPFAVPDFYVIETKWYGFDILKERLEEKKEAYSKTNFLFQRNKQIKMKDGSRSFIRDVAPPGSSVYEFDITSRDPKRLSQNINARYEYHPNKLTKSYEASLTHVLELLHRMGYHFIILYGVELNNSFYFWSDGDPKYGKVHHLTNKAHEGKKPTEPHGTIIVKDFIHSFYRRLMEDDKYMFVGTQKTVLYPDIPLVNWK